MTSSGLEGSEHLSDAEYGRVQRPAGGARMPESEAEWKAYWEIGADLSFERALRGRGYRVMRGPGDKTGNPIEVASDDFLGMFRKIYGDKALATGLGLLKRLRGTVWRTKEGLELTVDEMEPSHAQNLQRWLERRALLVKIASELEAGCAASDHNGGEMAHDDIEREFEYTLEAEPMDLLRRLPLYQAIVEKASIRA